MVIDKEFEKFMLTHYSYPGGPLENSWKKQASSFKKTSLAWKVEKYVGKDKLWNCIQLSPPTTNSWILVSWVVLPVTVDNYEWILETDTKHAGRRHNRSHKAVPYTLDDLFKLVSQQLIHEGEWGGVIKNSFENINKIEHLADDKDESYFKPSGNSEESTKKIKTSTIWLLFLYHLKRK